MKADYILQADLLDIIFEYRNKEYGAYPLRKDYDKRLKKALVIIFFFMGLLSVYSLLFKKDLVVSTVYEIPDHITLVPPKPDLPDSKVADRPKEPAIKPLKTNPLINNFLWVDSLEKFDPIQNLESVEIDHRTGLEMQGAPQTVQAGNGPLVTHQQVSAANTPTIVTEPDRNIPVSDVDILPSYPGGMKALTKFMERNLTNPEELNEGAVISVKVRFIVEYDGNLKGFEVIQDGGELFNKEVIRVLKKMPKWIPGFAKGENVSVYFSIPVKFVIQE